MSYIMKKCFLSSATTYKSKSKETMIKSQLVLVRGNKIVWEKRHKRIKTEHVTQAKKKHMYWMFKMHFKKRFLDQFCKMLGSLMSLSQSYILVFKVRLEINISEFKLKMYKPKYKTNNISRYLLKADYGPTLSKDRDHVLKSLQHTGPLTVSLSHGKGGGGGVFLKTCTMIKQHNYLKCAITFLAFILRVSHRKVCWNGKGSLNTKLLYF